MAPAAAPADAPKGDILLNGCGCGYESGNHLATATGAAGYAWREIAVIRPGAVDDSSWTGSGLRQALGAHPQPITAQSPSPPH